ncbi:GIY-YIG nuclease family protein [Patescibacteria group bacterium]|nr:GIY-YIG nuclease family protein [Patescibacteria group bacterium]MCG2701952.1 GIY-YIG nuclease family protein [Candidatus Parcubacteria bacterium]MBU4210189.1 GIY-YIG nuclease family protein [Patescibacteria group bacterium]MBU4265153.1 GIY-YIG nuclease family protein [Patescibacteria group bacterium]MBU4390717.1 GIY-YIG nuclease family protein [Patescibacteria group bacterium]
MKSYFLYILTNNSGTLYTGVTNNLEKRYFEHKLKKHNSFTAKYNINKPIYIEEYNNINEAIAREKQIKNWNRNKKISLIKKLNPKFKDLCN